MLKELLLSVVSGVIVALVLQMFGSGRRRETAPRQNQSVHNYRAARRGPGLFGRLIKLGLAVTGGIAFAQAVTPIVFRSRFDRFDRFEALNTLPPYGIAVILTVIGTILAYMILSIVFRR